jgi:hypothetical protein
MDTFIQKNILLDYIVERNEYVLSSYNSLSVTIVVETIMSLRENLNMTDDMILLNKLIEEIRHVIFENNEYIKMFYHGQYNNYIDEVNEIIFYLEDAINKINEYINYLNSADILSELMEDIRL